MNNLSITNPKNHFFKGCLNDKNIKVRLISTALFFVLNFTFCLKSKTDNHKDCFHFSRDIFQIQYSIHSNLFPGKMYRLRFLLDLRNRIHWSLNRFNRQSGLRPGLRCSPIKTRNPTRNRKPISTTNPFRQLASKQRCDRGLCWWQSGCKTIRMSECKKERWVSPLFLSVRYYVTNTQTVWIKHELTLNNSTALERAPMRCYFYNTNLMFFGLSDSF